MTDNLEKNSIYTIVLRTLAKPVVREASYGEPFAIYKEICESEQKEVFDKMCIRDSIYCSENYLCHVYDYFHRQLRMRKYLMADETRVQVLNEPERNPETDSWMWLFRSGEDGLPPDRKSVV